MKGFIEGGDKMLLGVLLNEAHNGLVLTDKIEKNPISLEAPFVKTDWEYVDQLDDQRITVLLFGERKAIFSVTEQLLESKNLSITNQGWKIVSTPTYQVPR